MVRPRYRCSWNDVACLDADYMAGWGAFETGKQETVDFDDDSHPVIGFEMVGAAEFRAVYRWHQCRSEPSNDYITSRVCLDRRPCRFGGTRVFFMCPICTRSTLRLAVLPEGLRCGACGRVTWGSRREGKIRRLIRKANKLAERLGSDSWERPPEKRPAHMRLTTYVKLESERVELAQQIDGLLLRRLARAGLFQQIKYVCNL